MTNPTSHTTLPHPPELRNSIYRHLLTSNLPLRFCPAYRQPFSPSSPYTFAPDLLTRSQTTTDTIRTLQALVLVSRTTHHEASTHFLATNAFQVSCYGLEPIPVYTHFLRALLQGLVFSGSQTYNRVQMPIEKLQTELCKFTALRVLEMHLPIRYFFEDLGDGYFFEALRAHGMPQPLFEGWVRVVGALRQLCEVRLVLVADGIITGVPGSARSLASAFGTRLMRQIGRLNLERIPEVEVVCDEPDWANAVVSGVGVPMF